MQARAKKKYKKNNIRLSFLNALTSVAVSSDVTKFNHSDPNSFRSFFSIEYLERKKTENVKQVFRQPCLLTHRILVK